VTAQFQGIFKASGKEKADKKILLAIYIFWNIINFRTIVPHSGIRICGKTPHFWKMQGHGQKNI